MRRRLRRSGVAVLGVLAVLAVAGCTPPPPEAVLHVPGTYTANLWEPDDGNGAKVVMCLDEDAAVHLAAPPRHPGIGSIRLQWSSGEYSIYSPDNVELITPVIPAGCGLLGFSVDCCTVDNFLTISAEKAPHI